VHDRVLKRADLSACVHKHTFERGKSLVNCLGCISAHSSPLRADLSHLSAQVHIWTH
jgi:hypothetical protein